MQLPTHRLIAESIAQRLNAYYGGTLEFRAEIFGSRGYWIAAARPGEAAGLLFHWEELDNGAAGWRQRALERLNAYRDCEPYVPTPPTQRVFSDVMTAGPQQPVVEVGR